MTETASINGTFTDSVGKSVDKPRGRHDDEGERKRFCELPKKWAPF
jgi:hypothetical protein